MPEQKCLPIADSTTTRASVPDEISSVIWGSSLQNSKIIELAFSGRFMTRLAMWLRTSTSKQV